MSRHTLRDQYNRTIGYLEEEPSLGRVKIMDQHSRTLGWYLPDRDVTTDRTWKVVARGNQLLRLLPSTAERVQAVPC